MNSQSTETKSRYLQPLCSRLLLSNAKREPPWRPCAPQKDLLRQGIRTVVHGLGSPDDVLFSVALARLELFTTNVENTGLNSSDVLATLLDLEMKGFVRQLGKLFSKVLP